VFAVTDRPEVHSKGFHFRFDKTLGSLLAPYWIEETGTSWPDLTSEFKTCIVLPLHQRAKELLEKLKENLRSVFHRNLLLFLRKISHVDFADYSITGNGSLIELSKVDLATHWIMCTKNDERDIWFIRRREFTPSRKRLPKDTDKFPTEVCVAIKFCEESSQSLLEEECDLLSSASRPSLSISVPRDLERIFAFLPTNLRAFKFVVQADFVLVTNRESFEENNQYNQELLDEIVILVTEVFVQLIEFCNLKNTATENMTALSELLEIGYRNELQISPIQLIDLLPVPSIANNTNKLLEQASLDICANLYDKNLFLASDSTLMPGHNLIYIPGSMKSIARLLKPVIELKLFDKKLVHEDLELKDEVLDLFSITKVKPSVLIDWLAIISREIEGGGASGSNFDILLRAVVSILCSWFEISEKDHHDSKPSAYAMSRVPIPSQVILAKSQTEVRGGGILQRAAKADPGKAISKQLLQSLKIWPLDGDIFESLNDKAVFVVSKDQNLKQELNGCLQLFPAGLIHILSKKFIVAADAAGVPTQSFVKFILRNFEMASGNNGLKSLEPKTIMNTIVLPFLEKDSSDATWRVQSAMLAFLFHNGFTGKIKCALPVADLLVSSEQQQRWQGGENSYVALPSATNDGEFIDEIHLGPEIPDSASIRLKVISTTLRQIGWRIIHPLCTWLALGRSVQDFDRLVHGQDHFRELLRDLSQHENRRLLLAWSKFLTSLGVVDFFDSKNGPRSSLFKLLKGLLKNATPVSATITQDIFINNGEEKDLRNVSSYVNAQLKDVS